MKLPLVVGIFLPMLAIAEEPKAVAYKVSEAGKGKDKTELMAVLHAVRQLERTITVGEPKTFKISQRLDAKSFLVQGASFTHEAVGDSSQRMGGGGNIVTVPRIIIGSKTYLLKTRETINAVDGEFIRDIYTRDTGKIYSYTAVDGGKASVRIFEMITPPPLLSQDKFVERLKAGESWKLPGFKTESCQRCFGDGKLSALKNYADCPDCDAKGGSTPDVLVIW